MSTRNGDQGHGSLWTVFTRSCMYRGKGARLPSSFNLLVGGVGNTTEIEMEVHRRLLSTLNRRSSERQRLVIFHNARTPRTALEVRSLLGRPA